MKANEGITKKQMKAHSRAVRTRCHEFSVASLCYFWWHVSMRVKPGEKLEMSLLKGTVCLGHCLHMYVIACKEINVLPHGRDHLPHCQTPSLKRIYTKAHSLNLHLLDLHPESWGMATRRGGKKTKRKQFRQTSTDCTHPGNETIITADWARNICGCSI